MEFSKFMETRNRKLLFKHNFLLLWIPHQTCIIISKVLVTISKQSRLLSSTVWVSFIFAVLLFFRFKLSRVILSSLDKGRTTTLFQSAIYFYKARIILLKYHSISLFRPIYNYFSKMIENELLFLIKAIVF